MPEPETGASFDLSMADTLAQAVNQAYLKYQDPNHQIVLPGYEILDTITVFEAAPAQAAGQAGSLGCDDWWRTFMGFSATGRTPGYPGAYNNLVALRGTQSTEEAIEDIDWSMTPCVLPAGAKITKTYGQISAGVSNFYSGTDEGLVTPLSACFKRAIANFQEPRPLYIGGHSLGGALVTLGALDAVVSDIYVSSLPPRVYTFGSMKVGDAAFGQAVVEQGIDVFRVVNLADWVPAFTGISADTPGYLPVGLECSFLWQTEDQPDGGAWANHSLVNIYAATLQKYPNVIRFGPRKYPQ
jgi:lipase (class 3)